MSNIATLKDREVTNSIPNYIISKWEDPVGVPANSDSTSLIIIELPGLALNETSYRQIPNKKFLTGVSYAIELIVFNISCLSTNYNIRILNKNDIAKLNTINEVAIYNNINLSNIDTTFDKFIIRNRDDSLINRLYLYVENNDIVNNTGTIQLEIVYVNLQDRAF